MPTTLDTPFFGGHTNVSQNTFLGLFCPMGSYIGHGMRMTVSSVFFCAYCHSSGFTWWFIPYSPPGHAPHIVTHLIHEYHVNSP
jgi:hypothetical protein